MKASHPERWAPSLFTVLVDIYHREGSGPHQWFPGRGRRSAPWQSHTVLYDAQNMLHEPRECLRGLVRGRQKVVPTRPCCHGCTSKHFVVTDALPSTSLGARWCQGLGLLGSPFHVPRGLLGEQARSGQCLQRMKVLEHGFSLVKQEVLKRRLSY